MLGSAERTELWVGAAVLAVAAGFLAWSTAGGYSLGPDRYELRAAFPNVDGIDKGTDVRVAGVKVGRVAAVVLDPESFQAEARLSLPGTIRLPVDSAALIQSDGLLGGAYIELQPGGAVETLNPGDEIEDVQGAVSLLSLMMKFVDAQAADKPASDKPASGGQE